MRIIDKINEWIFRYKVFPCMQEEIEEHKKQRTKFIKTIIKINAKLDWLEQEQKKDVNSAEYWNNKWKKSVVYYSAPRKKKVIEYVKDRKIQEISDIASKIISDDDYDMGNCERCILLVMKWIKKSRFKYKSEVKEKWNTPEETLKAKNTGSDCDDIGILMYFLLREIFMQLDVWDEVSHRLKCVAGHVHYSGKMNAYAGCHFYLLWLSDSCEWMTVETTFELNKAIKNFGNKPQKYNPQYGLIAFTFNELYCWSQKSLTVSKKDFKKIKYK